jgi:hypothetical protein
MLQGCAQRVHNDRGVQSLDDHSDRTSGSRGFVQNTLRGYAQGVQGFGRSEEAKKQRDWRDGERHQCVEVVGIVVCFHTRRTERQS